MQKIIIIISVLAMLLLREECHGQSGSNRYTAGINYTVGVPTFVPQGNVSKVAIDTGTMKWYEYATPGGWRWSGDRVQDISGCAAPVYTPGKAQSRLVLNNCSVAQNGHGPEMYKYTGSAWLCLNCGGNYTAGDGIDITGTEITNTAPDQVVSITGAGINAVTGTYPNFTVTGTEVDGSVTNELQTLSVAGNNLTISDGNTVTLPTPSSTLDALTDVTITSPANNQILQYNSAGSQWVNATLAALTGSGISGYLSRFSGAGTLDTANIYISGANVGIRTNAPTSTLTVVSPNNVISTNGVFGLSNSSGTNIFKALANGNVGIGLDPSYKLDILGGLRLGSSTVKLAFGESGGNSIFLGSITNHPYYFVVNTNEVARFTTSLQFALGTSSPNARAKLDVTSTTQGVLFPRMTATQRDAIAAPPDGLVLYNTTAAKLQVRAASAWVDLH